MSIICTTMIKFNINTGPYCENGQAIEFKNGIKYPPEKSVPVEG